MTFKDFIPEGENPGPIGKGGFQDFVPEPDAEVTRAQEKETQKAAKEQAKGKTGIGEETVEQASTEQTVENEATQEGEEVTTQEEQPAKEGEVLEEEKSEDEKFACDYCDFTTTKKIGLLGHMRSHKKKEGKGNK